MSKTTLQIHEIAKAICAEDCAFRGEPPCWQVEGCEGQLSPHCDEPGCLALATAVASRLSSEERRAAE